MIDSFLHTITGDKMKIFYIIYTFFILFLFNACVANQHRNDHIAYRQDGKIEIKSVQEILQKSKYLNRLKKGGQASPTIDELIQMGYISSDEREQNLSSVYRIVIPIEVTLISYPYYGITVNMLPQIGFCTDILNKRYNKAIDITGVALQKQFAPSKDPNKFQAYIITTPAELEKNNLIQNHEATESLCIFSINNLAGNTMQESDIVKISPDALNNAIQKYDETANQ